MLVCNLTVLLLSLLGCSILCTLQACGLLYGSHFVFEICLFLVPAALMIAVADAVKIVLYIMFLPLLVVSVFFVFFWPP